MMSCGAGGVFQLASFIITCASLKPAAWHVQLQLHAVMQLLVVIHLKLQQQAEAILLSLPPQGAADGTLPALQLQQLLDNLVQRELQPLLQGQAGQQVQLGGDGQLFLVGRALRLCAQLREAATPQQQDALLQAASTAGAYNQAIMQRRGGTLSSHCAGLTGLTMWFSTRSMNSPNACSSNSVWHTEHTWLLKRSVPLLQLPMMIIL